MLLDLYKLIRGFNDEHGVNAHVFEATASLIGLVLGAGASEYFVRSIKATENRYYFPEGTNPLEVWQEMCARNSIIAR